MRTFVSVQGLASRLAGQEDMGASPSGTASSRNHVSGGRNAGDRIRGPGPSQRWADPREGRRGADHNPFTSNRTNGRKSADLFGLRHRFDSMGPA